MPRDEFRPNSHAWVTEKRPVHGRMEDVTFLVRVMTIAEGYAMVRKKGAMPFVVSLSDMEFIRTSPLKKGVPE